jgi:thermitase
MKNQTRLIIGLIFGLTLLSANTLAAPLAKHVAGEYVIKFNQEHRMAQASPMRLQFSSGEMNFKSTVSSKHNIHLFSTSLLVRTESVIEELSALPGVELVEPNYIYEINQIPDDSGLNNLWGLKNEDKSNGGVDIDAEAAWGITTGSHEIVVAVIDTGINYEHPDLANNMWKNELEANGEPGVDDDENGFVDDVYGYDFANNDADPKDDNNHGSHCAGTIGAEGNNGIGVVGVNWKVSLMALKFLKGNGSGTLSGAIQSIDYATQMGADIMSNSWGGGGQSAILEEAIERAEEAGILFVAAAGNARSNNDTRPSYPASYETANVISVAATDRDGTLARFSNWGVQSVDIAAPGVDIYSTGRIGYRFLSGTSMATPHVSGVAALLLEQNPNLTYQELKEALYRSSEPLPSLEGRIAHGHLNAYEALLAAEAMSAE